MENNENEQNINTTIQNNEIRINRIMILCMIITIAFFIFLFAWVSGVFRTNPYIGIWEGTNGYTMTICENGTGVLTDGFETIHFTHKYSRRNCIKYIYSW